MPQRPLLQHHPLIHHQIVLNRRLSPSVSRDRDRGTPNYPHSYHSRDSTVRMTCQFLEGPTQTFQKSDVHRPDLGAY